MRYNLTEATGFGASSSDLSEEEQISAKYRIATQKAVSMSLLSWDVFMDGFQDRIDDTKKKNELKQLYLFAREYGWKNDLSSVFSEHDYEALIITDRKQKIIWVNDGFTEMTGYSKTHAINRTPEFLQGEETSAETKKRIKTRIQLDKPFKDVIVNHRKDKSIYKCEISIFPLHNHMETTHYLALEKQVD